MPVRAMPQADELVAAALARGLGDPAVTVESGPSGEPYARTPYVLVRLTASGTYPDPRLAAAPVVEVGCWHSPEQRDAVALAEACRLVLAAAPAVQHAPELGAIARCEAVSYPAPTRLEGQPGGLHYVPATYQVWIRPPRGADTRELTAHATE